MIDVRLWFRDDKVRTSRWSDREEFVSGEVRLEVVPRVGETVTWTSETGRTYMRRVAEVDWEIAADGKQSATLTLTDDPATEK